MSQERAIADILVRHGVLSAEQIESILAQQTEPGQSMLPMLAEQGASEERIFEALAIECGIEVVDCPKAEAIDIALATKVPLSFCKANKILIASENEHSIFCLTGDPLNISALDDASVLLGKPIVCKAVRPTPLIDLINRVFELQATEHQQLGSDEEQQHEDDTVDILESDDEAPIIRWVNSLFQQAISERASDIHIEPEEKEMVVRYRVDGRLYVARRGPRQFMGSVVARVKIMAGLNIAEKRLPQDGRISLKVAGRAIDIRVSTVPTSREHERIVMRILNKTAVLKQLFELGFSHRDHEVMDALIHRPNGIVLVTGPTGSGKTTTLYACINCINEPHRNILTAEDPVEYEIGGIHQVPVNAKIGLTFASALRAFLRQDPDVIMVGEIRDKETAEIAMHASMTGHFVLSTIHTNDAASAFTRLIQMGIEPFRVRSTVCGILAQRLVRVLCENCKEPYTASLEELEALGIDPKRTAARDARKVAAAYKTKDGKYLPVGWREEAMPTFHRPVGCEACDNKGYTGRMGIYELLVMEDEIGELVIQSVDAQTIKKRARMLGMETLRDDGARKVLAGVTTVDEVVSATQEDVFTE